MMINYNLFLYIIIYSFIGWCFEVLYAYKNQKKFVNRGFLNGPICPIYGVCSIVVISLLSYIHVNVFLLFIIATLLISLIEYVTSFVLEKIFKKRYWDYTDDPLNINGRICLHFSLGWGILAVLCVKMVHPFILRVLFLIPQYYLFHTSIVIFSLLSIDFICTLFALSKFKFSKHLISILKETVTRY